MPRSIRHYLNLPNSILRQSACGPRPHGAKRPLVLHLEQLENRHLMNGDPAPIAAASTVADVLTISNTEVATASTVSLDSDSRLYLPNYRPTFTYYSPPEGPQFDRIDELPTWLVAEADRRFGEQFGEKSDGQMSAYWGQPVFHGYDSDLRIVAFNASMTDSLNNFSPTNIQVAGVDEADLVETDGEFLYVISGNELLIIDVRDVDNPSLASRVELQSRPVGMYLDGDRLTLISSDRGGRISSGFLGGITTTMVIGDFWGGPYVSTPATTEVKVLDVADPTAPKLVQSTELDGRLVSSRMVDGELRLVLQQETPTWSRLLPQLQSYQIGFDEATQTPEFRFETRNEYLGRVFGQLENFVLPSYRTLSAEGEVIDEQPLLELDDLAASIDSGLGSATTIATFDTRGNTTGPTATHTLITVYAAEIYATENSLYVFGRAMPKSPSEQLLVWGSNHTDIWKFDFGSSNHAIKLSAQGKVAGSFSGQFSADEHEGFLRVVTSGESWLSGQALFVLEQAGNKLQTVGQVEDIAPGEQLHAVRFLGDKAYVVTFRNVDPLFAINLSDPTNPLITGELKIPGFSDYLQPLGENHLIGIGRGAEESIGRFQELQVSIFDVTDLDNPLLAHRYSFGGGRSTASAALDEHHAVSYFPEADILAIPIYSAYQGGDFRFGIDNSAILGEQESALQVFQIDTTTGFQPLATIKHDSHIMRSLRIGEQLIVVSADQVTIHDLDNPGQQRSALDLQIGSGFGSVELATYIAPEDLTGLNPTTTPDETPTTVNQPSATNRQSFAPRARRAFQPTPRAATVSASQALARDTATERLTFTLRDEVAESLAIDLALSFSD